MTACRYFFILFLFFGAVHPASAVSVSVLRPGRTTIGSALASSVWGRLATNSVSGVPRNYWTFDGKYISGSTVSDLGSAPVSGTLTGGVVPSRGIVGQALDFDGATGYVDAGTANILPSGVGTISVWVKLKRGISSSSCTSNYIISKGTDGDNNAWGLNYCYVNSTHVYPSLYYAGGGGGEWVDAGNITTDPFAWHHIVAVMRSNNTQELYFDGASVKTGALTTITPTADLPLTIGREMRDDPWAAYTNGYIDDIRIYTTELTATQIGWLYSSVSGTRVSTVSPVKNLGLSSGLVGHWTFDGSKLTATQALDSSGNSNTGTLNGGVTPTFGKIGQGLKFDGGSGYIEKTVANFQSSDQIGTISFWAKLTNSAENYMIISSDTATTNYYLCAGIASGKVFVQQYSTPSNNYVYGTTAVNDGQWHHVVITSNGSAWTFYIDGTVDAGNILVGSNNGNWFADTANRDNVVIGALKRTSVSDYFSGSLDDVRIYNRVLSTAEVLQLYRGGK